MIKSTAGLGQITTMTVYADTTTLSYIVVGFFIFTLAFLAVTVRWFYKKSETLLKEWATKNSYDLIEYELTWIKRGPFFWSSSSGQTVYRVKVFDQNTLSSKKGWVRCGSFWGGLFSSKTEVKWEN